MACGNECMVKTQEAWHDGSQSILSEIRWNITWQKWRRTSLQEHARSGRRTCFLEVQTMRGEKAVPMPWYYDKNRHRFACKHYLKTEQLLGGGTWPCLWQTDKQGYFCLDRELDRALPRLQWPNIKPENEPNPFCPAAYFLSAVCVTPPAAGTLYQRMILWGWVHYRRSCLWHLLSNPFTEIIICKDSVNYLPHFHHHTMSTQRVYFSHTLKEMRRNTWLCNEINTVVVLADKKYRDEHNQLIAFWNPECPWLDRKKHCTQNLNILQSAAVLLQENEFSASAKC